MALYLGKDLVSAFSGSGGTTIKNQDITVTENGTYTADSGYTGLGTVTVDVPTGGGDVKLVDWVSGTLEEVAEGDIAGATTIREYGFYKCTSLKKMTIPESVTSLGAYAFGECSNLEEIHFNAIAMSDLANNNNIFYKTGNSGNGIKVVISKKVTRIPAYLLNPYGTSSSYSPKVTSVEFEEGSVCSIIGRNAFNYLINITSVNIPNSVTKIDNYAFKDCSALAQITIPNSVIEIGDSAFIRTGLTSVVIPDGVTTILNSCFQNCTSLTSVTFNGSIAKINSRAFNGCTAMKTYDFTHCTSVPILSDKDAFTYIPSDCQIRVPASLYDEWIAATNWSNYASYIVAV